MKIAESTIRRSIWLFYGVQLTENANFTLGVYLLYFTEFNHFSFTQGLTLYASYWAASILFDLFGGGVADTLGRKRAYIVGELLYLAAYGVPVIFVHHFYPLLVLVSLAGVGQALCSNSIGATISELLEDDQRRFRRVNAHAQAVAFIGRTLASIVGGFLYHWTPQAPFAAEVVAYGLSIIFAVGIYEAPHQALQQKAHIQAWRTAVDAVKHLRQKAPQVLRAAVAALLASFLAGDLLFSYYQPFFRRHGFDAAALGILFAAISLVSAFGSWAVQFGQHRGWRQGIIAGSAGIVAINALGFATNRPQVALITSLLGAICAGCIWPTLRLITTEQSPPRIRASALSAVSTITSLGIIPGFLLSGALADHGSPQLVGALSILFCATAGLVLYAKQLRQRFFSGT